MKNENIGPVAEALPPADLKRMREAMGLSQAELSNAIGLGPNGDKVIRDAEAGERAGKSFALTPLAANCVRYLYAIRMIEGFAVACRIMEIEAEVQRALPDFMRKFPGGMK